MIVANFAWRIEVEKLSDFLRVSEAASYLGICPNTLRNWVDTGKIISVRHPVNDYRLFKRQDLDAILKKLTTTQCGTEKPKTRPR